MEIWIYTKECTAMEIITQNKYVRIKNVNLLIKDNLNKKNNNVLWI